MFFAKQCHQNESFSPTSLFQTFRNEPFSAISLLYMEAVQTTSSAIDDTTLSNLKDLRAKLQKMGGKEQLPMFLTGAGGCGKSHVINAARKFCHRFSQAVGVMFDATSFFLTAYLGSAAALWGGITIHSAAQMNKRCITDQYIEEWKNVRILVIDEVSYFSLKDLEKLDRKLKKLSDPGKIYGGVSIVFAGDFHQLESIPKSTPTIVQRPRQELKSIARFNHCCVCQL